MHRSDRGKRCFEKKRKKEHNKARYAPNIKYACVCVESKSHRWETVWTFLANNVQICSQIKTLHSTFSMDLTKSISNIKSRLSKLYKENFKISLWRFKNSFVIGKWSLLFFYKKNKNINKSFIIETCWTPSYLHDIAISTRYPRYYGDIDFLIRTKKPIVKSRETKTA